MMMMMGKKMSVAALAGVTVALFANTMTLTAAVCSNGLEGVQSTSNDVCCVDGCGVCGGVGCTPANTSALTAGDCCASEIVESGVFCDVSGAAPCIVTTAAAPADSVCINGQTGVQDPNTDVCCPLECGDFCGGEGCGTIPGVDASQCCAAAIIASGVECDGVTTPCTVVATAADNSTTCSNGLAGVEDPINLICCNAACGQCGGAGCGSIPGLSGTECCSDEIAVVNQLCSVTGAAPCVVDPPAFTPSMCPNGIAGVQDDTVCCAEACNGQCGGVGCGSIVGTNGADDCCSATILLTGVPCDVGVEAPCIMLNGTFTNAPMAAPTIPPPGATLAPAAAGNATTGVTLAPAAAAAGVTEAPAAGSRDFAFTEGPTVAGDMNGDGLVNSADTGVVGDTNGDGVVDGLDTGLVGDTNGDGAVNGLDEVVGATMGPTPAAPVVAATDAPTAAPTAADGSRDVDLTPSPADTNGDGVVDANDGVDTNGDGVVDENDGVDTNGDGIIDSNDGVDTNGDGVIDSNDGVDTNGDGVIDSNDGATAISATPAPLSDADAEASGNGAMSTVSLPAGSVYAGVVGLAAVTVGGVLLL